MNELRTCNTPPTFSRQDAERLRHRLIERGLLDPVRAEAMVYALLEISHATRAIFGTLVPLLLAGDELSHGELRDRLWDIREEFRHVAYHISDGLTDL